MSEFVNPYTFVRFVGEVTRAEPNGHEASGDGRLSGCLRVCVTVRTPLLLGGWGTSGQPKVPSRPDGTTMIPGSSLLGAVRSLHEAIVGGCLRVLDMDYVPVHRHPAHVGFTEDLALAVVVDAGDGRGRLPKVALCDEVVWVDKDLLAPIGPSLRLAATGDRLTLLASAEEVNGRRVLRASRVPASAVGVNPASVASSELCPWVLLVTDTRARSGATAYFAAGRLGARGALVTPEAWSTYLQCVEGSRDVVERRAEQRERTGGRDQGVGGPADEEFDDQLREVVWPPPTERRSTGTPIARRLAARPFLRKGQPVWVRVDGGEVTEIRLSQLWRRRGEHPVRHRVGEAGPCTDPKNLCWSCRVFGSADVSGRLDDAAATQHSYRGHVRVDDLAAVGECPIGDVCELAPLSSPRPSAGQFYLDASGAGTALAGSSQPPAATWGSLADRTRAGVRPVRGRKFYWRTADPTGGDYPRFRRRDHHTDETTSSARLVLPGAVFEGRITFDNLNLVDLGSLVLALDPRPLWPEGSDDRIVTSVGGGKPFGFGAISVAVRLERADSAPARYLGASAANDFGPGEVIRDAVATCIADVPPAARAGWKGLRHALTLGFVDDADVWYPPGEGDRGSAGYDQGFRFWEASAGVEVETEKRPLTALPDPAGSPSGQLLPADAAQPKHTQP
jgi:hypothetical protein